MRKLFTLTLAVIATAPTYADNITDGLAIRVSSSMFSFLTTF